MRPIWTGSLSFGLVNIPVKLYLAAKANRTSFRMLHGKDEGPIQFRRFCSVEEKEVPYEEIARGFEYEKGQFVLIEDKDFDRIERTAARAIEVQQFVGREEIPPMYFETPYYLEPTKGAERAYALMREALRQSDRVGLARFALRDREYLGVVHLEGDTLCLSTIRYPEEIRSTESLAIPGEMKDLNKRQLDLAMMLIDQLTAKFDPAAFKDQYQEQIDKMIQDKLAGMPVPKRAPVAAAQVVDLAEVLQKSIDEAKQRTEDKGEKGERRAPRQLAAKEAGRRKTKK